MEGGVDGIFSTLYNRESNGKDNGKQNGNWDYIKDYRGYNPLLVCPLISL